MTVCYFGMYHRVDSRNEVMISSLKAAGYEVIECHFDLWKGQKNRISKRSLIQKLTLCFKWLWGYFYLTGKYLFISKHDVVIVGVIGHTDVFLAWFLTRLKRKTLVFDAFLSFYQTLVEDREKVKPNSIVAKLLFSFDKLCCWCSDVILLDTNTHIDYFTKTFNINKNKFKRIWVSSPKVFQNNIKKVTLNKVNRNILFYGTFIPLQGVRTIIKAAALLKEYNFTIIGKGQEKANCIELAKELNINNITWIDWLPLEELPNEILKADIALGIFGNTRKANMVIPNKVFAYMAMGVPFITMNSTALNELLVANRDCITVPPNNSEELSLAIKSLINNPFKLKQLGESSREVFINNCSFKIMGHMIISSIIKTNS